MAHATFHKIIFEHKHHTLDMTCAITTDGYVLRWDRNAKASARILRVTGGKIAFFGGGSYAHVQTLPLLAIDRMEEMFPGFRAATIAFNLTK
jgi:hypothetical protein